MGILGVEPRSTRYKQAALTIELYSQRQQTIDRQLPIRSLCWVSVQAGIESVGVAGVMSQHLLACWPQLLMAKSYHCWWPAGERLHTRVAILPRGAAG